MTDDKTNLRDLPLPHAENLLSVDVARLRTALEMIDSIIGIGSVYAATRLSVTRNINGVGFNGTQDITITAAANGGTSAACSGNAATATKLATPRTINGVSFDGSANITITAAANGGTSAACSGNAATAAKLATARTINGVAFDGSANITIPTADSSKLPLAGGNLSGQLTFDTDKISIVKFSGNNNYKILFTDVNGNENPTEINPTNVYSPGVLASGTHNADSNGAAPLRSLGGIYAAKDIYAAGTVTAAHTFTPSDARLKDDIATIESALDKLKQLRGVTYVDKGTGNRRTGVIAQEVQEVLPEAVVQNGEYLAVAYGNLAGILIQAVNELAEKVDNITPRHKR